MVMTSKEFHELTRKSPRPRFKVAFKGHVPGDIKRVAQEHAEKVTHVEPWRRPGTFEVWLREPFVYDEGGSKVTTLIIYSPKDFKAKMIDEVSEGSPSEHPYDIW